MARTPMNPAEFRPRLTGAEGSVMPALNEGFRFHVKIRVGSLLLS
jgi:hypothetical protein